MAALNKEECEEHPRSSLAQNSKTPRSQENYLTQVSEEIERRVTKMLSEECLGKNSIFGGLSRPDGFLMNPLSQGYSGTTPQTSRNAYRTSQEMNEHDSQGDPHPSSSIFHKPDDTKLWPKRWARHSNRSSQRIHILLPQYIFWKADKEPLCQPTVRITLRQSKQTNFCWPFSSWQTTIILQSFIKTSTESSNCQNRSTQ